MNFSEEITSINKEITNFYRNAEDNERGSRGDLGVGGVSGETFHVCECCANLIFNKTINPTRTKTVLLIGMLVDQIVHHYYNPVHEDFEKKFKMPKLLHHGPNYIAHPAWFIREDRIERSNLSLLNGDMNHFVQSVHISYSKNMRDIGSHFIVY